MHQAVMQYHYTHGFSASKLAGDIVSFFTGFGLADTATPLLTGAKDAAGHLSQLLNISPDLVSPGVLDDAVKAGAALVVSFLSRVLFDIWEKRKERREKRKSESKKSKHESESQKEPENGQESENSQK